MTINFTAVEQPPVDFLETSENLYWDAAADLARALKAVREGRFDELKLATTAARELRQAYQLIMDERSRVEKLRKNVAGTLGPGELDLDAARDEIGRRLARLRLAAGD